MNIVRITASLAKKMKIKVSENDGLSETTLGDWFANDICLFRKNYILCVNEKSRIAVIVRGAPYSSWYERFLSELPKVLGILGVEDRKIVEEIEKMKDPVFAKTNSRSILGTMRDFKFHIEYSFGSGRFHISETTALSRQLADVPIGCSTNKYDTIWPHELALKLFGQKKPPQLKLVSTDLDIASKKWLN